MGKKITIGIFCLLQSTFFVVAASNDWASEIIEYTPGENVPFGYTNASAALWHASEITDYEGSNTAVSVINPPWQNNQIVSVGTGGKLILKMGKRVNNYDEPEHPFGIDLLVYGNTFFVYDYNEGLPETNTWYTSSEEPAEIWVSADLTNWFIVTNCYADALLPTQSIDINGEPSDYLYPPSPDLLSNDWFDGTWSYSNTVAVYDGSAGGAPVDLSQLKAADGEATNLSYINYVKIENPISGNAAEIDAIAAVAEMPEPFYLSFIIYHFLFISRKLIH